MDEMQFTSARYSIKWADFRHSTDENGDFWFVAKDWCDYLGLSNAADAYTRIPDQDKAEIATVDASSSQKRKMIIINEPGLYRLIFESRRPEAEELKNWVFRKLLPDLRKYGYYRLGDEHRHMLPGAVGTSANPTRFGRQPFLDVIRARGVSIVRAKEIMNELQAVVPENTPLINTTYHAQVYGKHFIQPALAYRAAQWLETPFTQLFTPAALAKIREYRLAK